MSATMGNGGGTMRKSLSSPSFNKTTAPERLSEMPEPVHGIQDEHFTYFLPKGMQLEREDKLRSNVHRLHKLAKVDADRVSFPFSGEGTGFRSQSSGADWWPQGSYKDMATSYRCDFQKRPILRSTSALSRAGGAVLDA